MTALTLTYQQFKLGTASEEAFAQRYWPYAQKYLGAYGMLDSKERICSSLATISIESGRLEKVEEGLYYKDPLRIATIFKRVFDLDKDKVVDPEEIEYAKQFVKNPAKLGQALYQGFHGRGLIQLTWEKNYRAYMDATGVDVINNKELLEEPEDAFRSACWFWQINGCNEAADTGSMTAVTRIVNGPALMHLAERRALYEKNMHLLTF